MHNNEAYFGGSPGPPDFDSRHFQQSQYGNYYCPNSNIYIRSHQGHQPNSRDNTPHAFASRGNNGWHLNPFEGIQSSLHCESTPFYPQHFNPLSGSMAYERQFESDRGASSGLDYAEWSTGSCPSKGLSGTSVDESIKIQDSNSSNENIGKSRRFSQQRNIREKVEPGRTNSASNNWTPLRSLKHEVRFSHQRDSPTKEEKLRNEKGRGKTIKEKSKISTENAEGCTDNKSAIERIIDKTEVDTVVPKRNTTNGKTKAKLAQKVKPRMSGIESSDSQICVLMNQLSSGTYECMVCCDRVKQQHAIWNCTKCFNVFHMGCIKKWARSQSAKVEGEGWRCPGCQNLSKKFPSTYLCFCGKVREPPWNRHEIPHSCGEICGKKRTDNDTCTHRCNILCHPGPCPPCPVSVRKSCLCGKLTQKVRCSDTRPLVCDEICGKKRNCGLHVCNSVCHAGECTSCQVFVVQMCYCGKSSRNVYCGTEESKIIPTNDEGAYSCGKICESDLDCENHQCSSICHSGPCKSCPLAPSAVTTCPCMQTKLLDISNGDGNSFKRISCLDPVPVCDKVCNKPLHCGGHDIHTCKLKCHLNECPPCANGETKIQCRCGKSEKLVPCSENLLEPYICDRRCNKKRKCGRHKCNKTCCTEVEHECIQICGRKLNCKLHRCEDTCHRGNCHTCYNVSFDELTCHCGSQVLYPPIPCGTKPPECSNICTRDHGCHHAVSHCCHNDDKCPPCVVLVKKKCNCGKKIRSNIPCHQENVSCGAPCKKPLSCGHQCLKPCHQGACMSDNAICTQSCSLMRVECIHPCASPCHHGKPCSPNRCKAIITLKCSCGNIEKQVECARGSAVYQSLASEAFARQQISCTTSVDISSFFREAGKQKILPCNEECSVKERNKRFAEALSLEKNESISLSVNYSSLLQHWVKFDPTFVRNTEQELTNLIETVEWMDKLKRDFMFPSMKREKRQVIHELAEVFKCKSQSYDEEPNRSVLVTAVKGISIIPRILPSESVGLLSCASSSSSVGESQSASRMSSGRGLLSSMKLVSMSSLSPSNYGRKSQEQVTTKRQAINPRMPASNRPAKEIPDKGSFAKSTSNPQYGMNHKQSKVNLKSTSGSEVERIQNVSACEPNIDYFDMTG